MIWSIVCGIAYMAAVFQACNEPRQAGMNGKMPS